MEERLEAEARGKPRRDASWASRALSEVFGLAVASDEPPSELPSYIDQNFEARLEDGSRVVLKVANEATARGEIEFESALMRRLEAEGVPVPPLIEPCEAGRARAAEEGIRAMAFVEGRPMEEAMPVDGDALRALGALCGRMDRALASFAHPHDRRALPWNLDHAAEVVRANASALEAAPTPYPRAPVAAQVALVRRVAQKYEALVRAEPRPPPEAVVHNDFNPHNILVDPRDPRRFTAVLDFGDATRTRRAASVAITAAHCMYHYLDRPLWCLARVLDGYCSEQPLGGDELRMVVPLAAMRLATSACMSARQRRVQPGNEHTQLNEAAKWDLLAALDSLGHGEVWEVVRRFAPQV